MPIEVELPDGTIAEFPDGMSNADIEGVLSKQFGQQPEPAKEMSAFEEYVTRPLGQTGRIVAGGAAALADTPRLLTDPYHAFAYQYAKSQGDEKAMREHSGSYFAPTYSQKAQAAYDELTDSKYVPANTLEKVVDAGGQILTGIMAGKGAESAVKYGANKAVSVIDNLKSPKVAPKTADEIADMASKAYTRAAENGGLLKPQFTNKFLSEIEKATPQTEAGKLLGKNNPVTKVLDDLAPKKGKPITLHEAQEIDEYMGDLIDAFTENGRLTKQGKRLLDVQTTFRNMIDNVGENGITGGREGFEALKEGRKLWSKAARMRDVEKIITRAEMMDNPATGIKTGFRTLFHNDKRMRGFTAEERKLIEKAANSGIVTDALRAMGSRLIPIGATATGNFGSAAAAQMATTASRNAATQLQMRRANRVLKEIAKDAAPNAGEAEALKRITSQSVPLLEFAGGVEAGAQQIRPPARNAMPIMEEIPQSSAIPQEELPSDLRQDEGQELTSYTDTTGNRTVGVGFNMDSGIARKAWKKAGVQAAFNDVYAGEAAITPQEAERLAMVSYQAAMDDAREFLPAFDKLTEGRKQALANLSYQLGSNRLAKFTGFKSAMNKGDYVTAARELVNSKWFDQTQDSRKRRVIQQILKG